MWIKTLFHTVYCFIVFNLQLIPDLVGGGWGYRQHWLTNRKLACTCVIGKRQIVALFRALNMCEDGCLVKNHNVVGTTEFVMGYHVNKSKLRTCWTKIVQATLRLRDNGNKPYGKPKWRGAKFHVKWKVYDSISTIFGTDKTKLSTFSSKLNTLDS